MLPQKIGAKSKKKVLCISVITNKQIMKQDRQTFIFWCLGAKSPLSRFHTKNKKEVYLKTAKFLMWPWSQKKSAKDEAAVFWGETSVMGKIVWGTCLIHSIIWMSYDHRGIKIKHFLSCCQRCESSCSKNTLTGNKQIQRWQQVLGALFNWARRRKHLWYICRVLQGQIQFL